MAVKKEHPKLSVRRQCKLLSLMRKMRLRPIYQAPRTSQPHAVHRIYPFLFNDMAIPRPNQVWCADMTYIPMQRGFLYLVAIMDWATRRVLSWRLSNTMDADFCVEALEDAMAKFGKPEIFNSDQGSQFTSGDFKASGRTDQGIDGRQLLDR